MPLYLPAIPNGKGTAFPTAPATNAVWFRTDDKMLYQYDGTRWLCTCPHYIEPAAFSNVSATTVVRQTAGIRGTVDKWVESVSGEILLASGGTALSAASHQWVVKVTKDPTGGNALSGGGTALATFTVDGTSINPTADVITALTPVTVDALLATTSAWLDIRATKTGTPGNFYVALSIKYRFVGT